MLFLVVGKDGRATRGRIRTLVQDEPGIHVSEIAERLAISWHTAGYHLGILARSRLVHLEKNGRERRVFPSGLPPRHRQWLAALRTEQAAEVLRILLRDPRLSVPVLSRRMGFSEKIVRRQVERLAEAGLVERRGELRPVYQPSVQAVAGPETKWLERRLGLPPLGDDDVHGPPEGRPPTSP